ncbi:hypothetical protein HPB51_018069 [Rhipicephalus microplus]|uniref:Uncharacterized protein n=1 Tax=Rhipicephalus microplus TaxID=6941 RepID=A0A9J6E353_RHIMP|nr:hypothetical protein HPB51_018069 [Rhipicephalus microplus]
MSECNDSARSSCGLNLLLTTAALVDEAKETHCPSATNVLLTPAAVDDAPSSSECDALPACPTSCSAGSSSSSWDADQAVVAVFHRRIATLEECLNNMKRKVATLQQQKSRANRRNHELTRNIKKYLSPDQLQGVWTSTMRKSNGLLRLYRKASSSVWHEDREATMPSGSLLYPFRVKELYNVVLETTSSHQEFYMRF